MSEEEVVIMFILSGGEQRCEECGEGFVEDDPKGVPCVFDIECPVHEDEKRQIIFHESCMPEAYAEAMKAFQKATKAWLN